MTDLKIRRTDSPTLLSKNDLDLGLARDSLFASGMPVLALLLLLSTTAQLVGVLSFSAKFVDRAHESCLRAAPARITEREAWQSLLCGRKVTEAELREDLRRSSLLHLFVVSGSHLIWLERLLIFVHLPAVARLVAWAAFAALSGADPPVIRAALGLSADLLVQPFVTRWRGDQRVLFAGLLTLALNPDWYASLSLALSWAAALALGLPAPRGWRGELLRATAAWAFLLPLLAGLSPAHPLGILVNLLCAPVVGAALLPLAVVAMIPGLEEVFDGAMMLFRGLLRLLRALPEYDGPDFSWSPSERWVWIFGLHLALHASALWLRQGRARPRTWRAP